MKSNNHFPKWWQLYLIFPLLYFLFLLDSRLKISTRGHQIVQILSLVLILSFVFIWLKASTDALSRLDQKKYGYRLTGIIYQHENKLPLEKDPYAEIRPRNTYTGGHRIDPVYEESDQTGYSLTDDVRQEMDKE